ncbi:hypothetical protein PBOI14_66760 [Pseudomonas sp. Boi14]|nr:hypothetical protein PBOI14_66760 [Pseudomonas sp. Boi14]
MNVRDAQDGMTLIEVLVALLILAVGLLGAAAVQIKALQYTDSSRMTTQASFIAYDMLDRIRANAAADYSVAIPAEGNPGNVRDQDLYDFAANIASFAGPAARAASASSSMSTPFASPGTTPVPKAGRAACVAWSSAAGLQRNREACREPGR